MGIILSCGTACDWEGTSVSWASVSGDFFKIGINTVFGFQLVWENTDCPDPQTFSLYYRRRPPGATSFGSYILLDSATIGDCTGTKAVKTNGTVTFSLLAQDQASRNIWFCQRGFYEVVADSDCTVGQFDALRARPIRVQVN